MGFFVQFFQLDESILTHTQLGVRFLLPYLTGKVRIHDRKRCFVKLHLARSACIKVLPLPHLTVCFSVATLAQGNYVADPVCPAIGKRHYVVILNKLGSPAIDAGRTEAFNHRLAECWGLKLFSQFLMRHEYPPHITEYFNLNTSLSNYLTNS